MLIYLSLMSVSLVTRISLLTVRIPPPPRPAKSLHSLQCSPNFPTNMSHDLMLRSGGEATLPAPEQMAQGLLLPGLCCRLPAPWEVMSRAFELAQDLGPVQAGCKSHQLCGDFFYLDLFYFWIRRKNGKLAASRSALGTKV